MLSPEPVSQKLFFFAPGDGGQVQVLAETLEADAWEPRYTSEAENRGSRGHRPKDMIKTISVSFELSYLFDWQGCGKNRQVGWFCWEDMAQHH